jgi:sugar lactone lactonase YvrE
MKDGLYGTEVRSFSFDEDKNIYTATMNGIERLNNTSKEWELIGMDHFPDLNTWISMMAISVSDEGTIFAGSRQYGLYISRG